MRRVLFLLFFTVILLIIVGCSNENEEIEQTASSITPVEVAEVRTGDLKVESSIFGNVMPSKQTPVLLQQAGELTDLKVENGDEVKKDDRLGTIKTPMGNVRITAPTTGKIAQMHAKKDDFLSSEQPFAVIYDDETLLIQFNVTSQMRTNFEKEQTVDVIIAGETYEAEITLIENLPNEVGQFTIQAEIENDEGAIIPGEIAEIVVQEVREKDTLLIATESIVTESDETFVYIVTDDEAKKVPITIKEMHSEETAVEATLTEDDQVITSGQFLLSDGSKVEIVSEGRNEP